MERPLKEHFEVDTDAGSTLRTFDYIKALEQYIDQLREENERLKEKEIRGDRMIVDMEHSKAVYKATIKELVEALEETRSTYSEHISFDDNRKIESILSKVKGFEKH